MTERKGKGKVNLGVIGCGGMARGHVHRFAAMPEVRLAGFADTNLDAAMKMAQMAKVKPVKGRTVFAEWQEMLNRLDLDAIFICTPHTLHFEQIMAGLERGLHVLTEKPMVCTVRHAKAVVKKARETGKTVLVSYQRRYQSTYRHIHDAVRQGNLGEIKFVTAWMCQNWLSAARGKWRTDPKLGGGGMLIDSGSHLVDNVLWCSGLRAKEVFAYTDHWDLPVDIASAISITFDNGALGTISTLGEAVPFRDHLAVFGTEGAFYLAGEFFFHEDHSGNLTDLSKQPFPPVPGGNPDQNFIDCILGRSENQSPPEAGLLVAELTEAAYKSAKTREPVKVF